MTSRSRRFVGGSARDALFACRLLWRSPGFAIAALVTLGLAIAVNTAVFTVVDGVLLKPLPYPAPDRLARVVTWSIASPGAPPDDSQNGTTWEAVRDKATTIDHAVFSSWTTGVNLTAGERASHVQQQRVGAGFFQVLGVRPAFGREFTVDEDRRGGPDATILSDGLWRTMFAADPSVVGRTLVLRGNAVSIVGVMPPGLDTGVRADLWTPLRASTTGEGEGENYGIVVRLRPGVTLAQADVEVRRLGASIPARQTTGASPATSLGVQSLQQTITEQLRRPLLLLWLAVAVVLVVASVNLAGLMMARTSSRTQELAMRVALGSGRSGVLRQLTIEGIVIAVLGACAGLASAPAMIEALMGMARPVLHIWQPVTFDWRAIAIAGVLALAASVIFAVLPALHTVRLDVSAGLVQGGSRTIAGRSTRWPSVLLVLAQVALGVVLLVGAGLLLRTFAHLRRLTPGFDPSNVVAATVSLDDERYGSASRVTPLFDQTLARIRAIPGVEGAAVSLGLPYERLLNLGFRYLDGPQASSDRGRISSTTYISSDYFWTMRIPLRAGRVFDDRDRANAPGVVIVNESFARQYFEGSALNHRIRFAGMDREIVGIVGDVQVRPGWGDFGPSAAMPLSYLPIGQANDAFLRLVHGWFSPSFIVRAPGPVERTGADVRRALDAIDPLLPFASVRRISDVRSTALAQPYFLMTLLGALALAAVLLASLGIHGLIGTSVAERTREMGIRMALGATPATALRSLALPGIVLAAIGTVIGAIGALGLRGLLEHFLWGVAPSDPLTFVAVGAVLLAVASIASVLPAWRVMRLDPARTLRE